MSREQDAEVAEKIFGYTLDYEFEELHGAPCVKELRDQYDEWGVLPAYSTDVAAAWLVVEKLTPVYRVSVHQFFQQWQCTLERRDGKARMPIGLPHDGDVSATAPTAPEAICRAALAAMEKTHGNR